MQKVKLKKRTRLYRPFAKGAARKRTVNFRVKPLRAIERGKNYYKYRKIRN
ncbi:hypothetical protein GGTG_10365 [Gaeumannomyces tritici R3-111a-1]|uniref:Uncharacterized protein n=1 Tax=Gaeumannomyces tritici (strain R3-111a-1) TaxID=644352 RepID=J3PA41_GAET3|nr:hypothetical protein GGTG_10365 [Gaeumannomyces tritici R3-111a-1]EJT73528.1 hypothetical protein GGTG_10365 [Gaeumannomyces tritici R3-111a-1]